MSSYDEQAALKKIPRNPATDEPETAEAKEMAMEDLRHALEDVLSERGHKIGTGDSTVKVTHNRSTVTIVFDSVGKLKVSVLTPQTIGVPMVEPIMLDYHHGLRKMRKDGKDALVYIAELLFNRLGWG